MPLISPALATTALGVAAALTFLAALLHWMCIVRGAPAFRFLGAGEALARMAERGHWYPPLIAFVVGALLALSAAYALAGAGWVAPLPGTPYALAAIAAVFVLRAVMFPLLKPAFPENSTRFWWVTSGICLVIGLAYALGAVGVWPRV